MVLGKVIGTVTSTVKHPLFVGRPTFVIQPLDENGKPDGSTFLAFDLVQAGVGDTVLILKEGNGCRQITGIKNAPFKSMVVGVVDEIDLPLAAEARK
jgi:ethanolamine utilization protein EutN